VIASDATIRERRLAAFRRADGAPPKIFGHRGARGEGAPPENTMEAFEHAANRGAAGIETDVRVCATGELVCVHDPSMSDGRVVASIPATELARDGVPLLRDVLAMARRRGLAVNVELKRDVPDRGDVVEAAARLLAAWDPTHAVLVSSFDPPMLARFGLACGAVPRAQIVHESRYHAFAARLPGVIGCDAIHLERTIASPDRIARLRGAGLVIGVWTVNDASEARDLAELGVDSLITDVLFPGAGG
jgi:glycerophosphoryl diester phosphodiesterase